MATTKKQKNPTKKVERNFFEDVYAVVKLIPKGRVTSYGAIARYLGTGMSARMVGWAMNAVPPKMKIPAYKVVNSQGLLTGRHHFNPPIAMQERLEKEGIKVVKDKVQEFEKRLWDPRAELM